MYETVSEKSISDMVDTFYGAIQHDPLLGPIFAGVLRGEWTPHLSKMKSFWSSVLLASCTYKGNPMLAHLALPRLSETHFERWLQLWRETARALCSKELADVFIERAETIGARLLYAVSQYHEAAVRARSEGVFAHL
jgi:hemoglobin